MAHRKPRMTIEQAMERWARACEAGQRSGDRVSDGLPASPEAHAASFLKDVMEGDEASAEEIATTRFVG
jgi:hypothetical protein